MLLEPRNGAPLFALTAAMSSASTDDPEFYWWDESVNLFNFSSTAGGSNAVTTIPIDSGALQLKPGDMLRVDATGEAIRVATVVSDTSITVTRAVGPGGTPAGTAATIPANAKITYVGSAYREGAPRSVGVSTNPVKRSNVTQIFRDPVEWTRTAMKTRTRTGDTMAQDRRRALNKHSVGIERALWLGTRYETMEAGQPIRYTDGLLNRIPTANVKTAAATTNMDQLEALLLGAFAYGSGEKLAFGSLSTIMLINQIVRKNTQYQWGPTEKEYGMQVKRLFSAAGTLVLTEHPLFGQAGQFLANDLVIMDTANLKYRYITDTTLLKDREDRGQDGKAEEYLTEAGLEVHHPDTFFWIKGLTAPAKDA